MAPVPALDLLGAERREEGRRFVEAIQDLGLFPDIACWVQDRKTLAYRIALITPLVDRIGARPLYVVLEKAYEAAAITIDPLEIELFSPLARFTIELRMKVATWSPHLQPIPMREETQIVDGRPVVVLKSGEPILIIDDLVVAPSWGYPTRRHKRQRIGGLDREYQAFKEHVQRIAA